MKDKDNGIIDFNSLQKKKHKVASEAGWSVEEYYWCTAVKEDKTGKYYRIFLKPDGQEINVENLNVEVHENGIEFL